MQIMKQMWPYIGNYVEGVLRTTVQQSVRGSLPNKFQNFSFETVELGDTVCCICAGNLLYVYRNCCQYFAKVIS